MEERELTYNYITEQWIEGIKYMSPRPLFNHMTLEGTIYAQLLKYFSPSCAVGVETSLWLTNENVTDLKNDATRLKELLSKKKGEVVPDIAVYCDKGQAFRRGFLGVPKLVVEVISEGSISLDTEVKKKLYSKYGVSEYWIVYPVERKINVFRIEEGSYVLDREFNFLEEEIKSTLFEDLLVDIRNIELLDDSDL